MQTIIVGNVNEALYRGVQLMKQCKTTVSPRGKRTIEWPEPVATVYRHSRERVVFSPQRDANPFFHFFEGLWMLAGRDDVKFVEGFNKRMRDFSDDGRIFYGAYGRRWREGGYYCRDQLTKIVEDLRDDPDSRRAVLAMWNVDTDLYPEHKAPKDLPCNTHIYFKVREANLNMTVCCRSNDMLWGAYGANAVHLSMLHEYMAGRIGVGVGHYTQISDSFHIYLDGAGGELWDKMRRCDNLLEYDLYDTGHVTWTAMNASPSFDRDLRRFFEGFDEENMELVQFATPYFNEVVMPLYRYWFSRDPEDAVKIMATDWRTACLQWVARREEAKRGKETA